MEVKEIFFKHVLVSCEIEKYKNEWEKVANTEDLKRFRVELVAEDCEQSIKNLVGKEVVLDFSNIKKLKTENNRNYYICQQSNIILL